MILPQMLRSRVPRAPTGGQQASRQPAHRARRPALHAAPESGPCSSGAASFRTRQVSEAMLSPRVVTAAMDERRSLASVVEQLVTEESAAASGLEADASAGGACKGGRSADMPDRIPEAAEEVASEGEPASDVDSGSESDSSSSSSSSSSDDEEGHPRPKAATRKHKRHDQQQGGAQAHEPGSEQEGGRTQQPVAAGFEEFVGLAERTIEIDASEVWES